MADKTQIEWTDATWNPVRGCSRISEGCRNCYAESVAARFSGEGQAYEGLAKMTAGGPRWTGKVRLVEPVLPQPFAWQRPRRIFVNSMSDLFHESLLPKEIAQVFAVMALTPRHTFQVLTKRATRMWHMLRDEEFRGLIESMATVEATRRRMGDIRLQWPLPNVWLGVSVEDQKAADERILPLLGTPAAVRFLSCEPLLGPVNIGLLGTIPSHVSQVYTPVSDRLHWIIVGGESGHGARPMHPNWARAIRDECQQAGVSFFFKQWGEWRPGQELTSAPVTVLNQTRLVRVGKHTAGRELDGRTWDEFPGEVR